MNKGMVKSVRFLEAGYCTQFERIVNPKTAGFGKLRFPASVAVIEHPTEGVILFDTGYSPRFHEATRYFPEKFYALITPVQIAPEETALSKLQKLGIQEKDVRHVVLSHFHADHVAGAGDFRSAQYLFPLTEYRYFQSLSRLGQVKEAFLKNLLPSDFEARMNPLSRPAHRLTPIPELGAGWNGQDLFNDGSVFSVSLPGHTVGQLGLFVRAPEKSYFLVADAAWTKSAITHNTPPFLAAQLIMHDRVQYASTLTRLHELHQQLDHQLDSKSSVEIIPCHCHETLQAEGLT